MSRKLTYELWWLVVIVATFFVLNCFSVHTGDDLGYMFADTTHHSGDGERVTTLSQCFTTQCHHYMTTNGRFAVHVVVMAMLNLVPLWVYRLLNALMFGALWMLTCRLARAERTNTLYAVAWTLLLLTLPQPGMVLLTLVSYAVNYLWVAVAIAGLLLALQRCPHSKWLVAYAIFAGSLQESFSLPLAAGLLVGTLLKRVPVGVTVAFCIGTAIEVLAPGNMAHAAQGGGFTLEALSHKIGALCVDLCYSILTPAAVALVAYFLCKRQSCLTFIKENIVLVVAVVVALALAMLTFTSPRQLTCPTLFVIILLLKFVPSKRALTVAVTAVTVAAMGVMGVYKYGIQQRYDTLLNRLSANGKIVYPDGDAPNIATNPITRGFIPDPLCNRGLVAIGDKYTKKGLERLRNTEPITTLLPASPQKIAAMAPHTFTVTRIPAEAYKADKPKFAPPYEVFSRNDTVYVVQP